MVLLCSLAVKGYPVKYLSSDAQSIYLPECPECLVTPKVTLGGLVDGNP